MTVGTKVKQTLANLKGCQADFESYAMETQDQQAKQLWTQAAQQTQSLIKQVESRIKQIEQQEPQYKGF
ncbi:MAG TPA: DUF1657 domain-containing protein [Bacillota bacterium]